MSSSFERYRAAAIVLHWLIAALLITNIGLAWWFNTLEGTAKIAPIQLHKSIGITVMLLTLVRIAIRFLWPPPPLPAYVTGWERRVAGLVYLLFYGVMLGSPLTGWALSSASRLIQVYPITLYGLVPWPAIGPLTTLPPDQMKQTHDAFVETHHLLAKLAYGLIALHVAAALRHQFIKRDDIVARMVPFLKSRVS